MCRLSIDSTAEVGIPVAYLASTFQAVPNHSLFILLEQVVELDLHTVVPCCSGPKRPQDKVSVSDMKKDFETCLGAKVGTGNIWANKLMHASKSCLCSGTMLWCCVLFVCLLKNKWGYLTAVSKVTEAISSLKLGCCFSCMKVFMSYWSNISFWS